MRRILVLSLVMLLGLSLSASAVKGISLRMEGLGEGLAGIVDDPYTDFNLFPALVVDLPGTMLFTNLSNLSGWEEPARIFAPGEVTGSNVFGLATDLLGGKGGFLVENEHYLDSYSDKTTYEEEYPEVTEEEAAFAAAGGGSYLAVGLEEGSREVETRDVSVFYGTTLASGVKVGGRVGLYDYKYDDTYAESETVTETWDEYECRSKSARLSEYQYKDSVVSLKGGAQFQAGDFTVDVAGFYAPGENNIEARDSWTRDRSFSAGGEAKFGFRLERYGDVDDCLWDWYASPTVDSTITMDTFGLRARASKETTLFGQDAIGRVFGNLSFGSGSSERQMSYSRLAEFFREDRSVTLEADAVTTETADYDDRGYEIGGGYQVSLGENTILGLGLRLGGSRDKTTRQVGAWEASARLTCDDGAEDPTVREWSAKDTTRLEMEEEYERFYASIPVGLEHKLTDRVTLRLGAEAFLADRSKWSSTSTTIPGEWECTGPSDEVTYEGLFINPDRTITDEAVNEDDGTSTVYSTGLGFALSENVQLDVVHFTNLTDLRDWKVSATIRF